MGKEQKTKHVHKADVPQQSILALIQIQEFEDLFDELFECEHSKLRLIRSTSKEIDKLRQRIIYLSNQSIQANPSKKFYFRSFLSSFLSFRHEANEKETFE